MFSSSVSKRTVLVPILSVVAITLFFIRSVTSINETNAYLYHKCFEKDGKYKPNSLYEKNLDFLISNVWKNASVKDYIYGMEGGRPNTVYILIQCRGDSYGSKCDTCRSTAYSELRKRCPMKKGAIVWFDRCLLKISPTTFLNEMDLNNKFYMYNKNKVRDPVSFNSKTKTLLTELTKKATRGGPDRDMEVYWLYETGDMKLDGKMKLYGMVQCTRDIKETGCKKCLNRIIGELPNCCDGKEGGRVVSASCNFRYESYPFLDTRK
ncbi:unnamed protein product [Eruca vesicaria subsp. sativa]|uniref:Gnk2-homologous domain-containing protein n=1 Tax=Eruca vesicaria subsp. sativa TaxID=29727 RepID=A0ABC8KK40_ERUVS|nr:unnamed protein product [Eruca vesicaria subsp. sativa]